MDLGRSLRWSAATLSVCAAVYGCDSGESSNNQPDAGTSSSGGKPEAGTPASLDAGSGGMGGGGGTAGQAGSEGLGGAGGSAAEGPTVVCPSQSGPIDPTALIDDLEDGDGNLPQLAGRTGGWFIGSDETEGGTLTPAANDDASPPAEPIPGGRCGSQSAMRLTGQGFDEWGAVLGIGFRWGDPGILPFDASSFKGVRFWARVGELHTAPVRVQFQDVHTNPDGGHCVEGGELYEECYDGFGTLLLPLTEEWQEYEIHFDRLAQQGFGLPAEIDPTQLYSLEWTVGPSAIYDLWIDDVRFFD